MEASGVLDEIFKEGDGHVLDIQLQPEIFTACCVFLDLVRCLEHTVLRGPAVLLLCLVANTPTVSPQCSNTKSF